MVLKGTSSSLKQQAYERGHMNVKKSAQEILDDEDFKELAGRKKRLSLVLTLMELVLYYGFVTLIAFYKPFLSTKISGAMNMGIPIAAGTIFLSWVLTVVYVWWANNRYDVLVKKFKDKLGY